MLMIKPRRRSSLTALTVTAAAVITACTGAVAGHAATVTPSAATTATPGPASSGQPATAARVKVTLTVPYGMGGGPFSTPRTLTMPSGWTAKVWARVGGPRMEAWSPQKWLLVSEPRSGTITAFNANAPGNG